MASPIVVRYGGVESRSVDKVDVGIKIGIFGPGGAGKTTLAATAADSEFGSPALYLNARGNPEVVRSYGERIHVIDVDKFARVEAIRQDILRDPHCPFKTVILDNVSELHALDLRDQYGANAEIKWQMHSRSTADILALVRNWSDLATVPHLRLNVVFVMWETSETRTIRGQDVNRSELALNKALQAQVPGIVSWLGRLYIVGGPPTYTRCLDFRPIETQQVSKWQVDPEDPLTKLLPMEWYNPSLASVLDTLKGGKPWPADKHSKPRGAGAVAPPVGAPAAGNGASHDD